MKDKRIIILTGLLLFATVLAVLGFAYAYFQAIISGDTSVNKLDAIEGVTLNFGDSGSINSGIVPGQEVTKTIYVTNNDIGSELGKIFFYFGWKDFLNEFLNNELYIKADCKRYKYYNTEDQVEEGVCQGFDFTPITNTEQTFLDATAVDYEYTHEYFITIRYMDTDYNQESNVGNSFSAKLIAIGTMAGHWYEGCLGKNNLRCKILSDNTAYADNIPSEFVTGAQGIDFSNISSDTNGKGLYYTTLFDRTTDLSNDSIGERVYYYRGDVDNNYAVFANYCWRIVRTVEDGTVRLVYGGIPTIEGGVYTCPQTGTDVNIGTSAYNTRTDDNTFIGYMHKNLGAGNSTTLEEAQTNEINSSIKTTIDNWYYSNILNKGASVTSLIADTPYCNDRNDPNNIGFGNNTINYPAYDRLNSANMNPSLRCTNANDRFTVSNSLGNGNLIYPIALLTADEATMAGLHSQTYNTTFYLYSNQNYWLLSPSNGVATNSYLVSSNSNLTIATTDSIYACRPSISLNSSALVSSGTGEYNLPYMISVN